ncbi:MAG: hypothetical protein K6F84_07545 [Lachnospiraceae bacterium]|nr:hypothetical protein [Lachnospiraceae bacterium]
MSKEFMDLYENNMIFGNKKVSFTWILTISVIMFMIGCIFFRKSSQTILVAAVVGALAFGADVVIAYVRFKGITGSKR